MQNFLKYTNNIKPLLFGFILFVYLISTFNQLFLDYTHVLTHQFTDGNSYHSHHHNFEETDHDHFILDISKIALRKSNFYVNQEDKIQELSIHKILDVYPSTVFQIDQSELKSKKSNLFNLLLPKTPFLEITTPPPEFII